MAIPLATVWSAPALATGASLRLLTVIVTVSLFVLFSSSVTVRVKLCSPMDRVLILKFSSVLKTVESSFHS